MSAAVTVYEYTVGPPRLDQRTTRPLCHLPRIGDHVVLTNERVAPIERVVHDLRFGTVAIYVGRAK